MRWPARASPDAAAISSNAAGLGPEGDRVYRTIYRRTVAVVANIVPPMPEDAFFNRQVWRAADGSVVNTVKPTF